MKSEVFTNRFEVEKMAEDIFVCDDKPFILTMQTLEL